MNDFLVCSYYTKNTPYETVAQQYLIPSTAKLDLKSFITGVSNLGSWQKNTSMKPKFIRECLDHNIDNVVFIDCDAEILKCPTLFNDIPENVNFAAHILDWDTWYQNSSGRKELLSGTLFVRNSKRSHDILDEWVDRCKISKVWEQQVLQQLLEELKEPVFELPIEYCYMKTLPNGTAPHVKVDDPIIVHHQASRTLRHKIK